MIHKASAPHSGAPIKHTLKDILFTAVFGACVGALIFGASQSVAYRPFMHIQNKIDDSLFIRRFMAAGVNFVAGDDIVIVDIDDASLSALGDFKRWPRRHFAKVVGALKADSARIVFFDLVLRGESRDNAELADSLSSAGNVIAGYYFELNSDNRKRRTPDTVYDESFSPGWVSQPQSDKNRFIFADNTVLPYTGFSDASAGMGFANYIPDPDGIIRHIPIYIARGRKLWPSAALRLWIQVNGMDLLPDEITPRGVRFGDRFIPADKHSFMRLDYRANRPVYPRVSFRNVLNGRFVPGTFTGKIVMIGSSAERLRDLKPIPGYNQYPGVEIHAVALSSLLNGSFIEVASGATVLALTVFCGMAVALVFAFAPPLTVCLPVAVAAPVLLYLRAVYMFINSAQLTTVVVPSFAILMLYLVITIHRVWEHRDRTGQDHTGNARVDRR